MRNMQGRAASAALFNPQEVLDQLPNAVLLIDQSSAAIVYANSAAEIALKISQKNMLGHQIKDIFG